MPPLYAVSGGYRPATLFVDEQVVCGNFPFAGKWRSIRRSPTAAAIASKGVKELALSHGFYLLEQQGDNARITEPETKRVW